MATTNNNKLTAQPTVEEIGNRICEIAAQMAGFKPSLDQHLEDVDKNVGDSLAMLAGMAEYVQFDLSVIGEQLIAINQTAG